MMMARMWITLASALVALPACASPKSAADAALALAEAHHPGKFSVAATRMEKNRYRVVLAAKDDPFTRVALFMDPDPADCRLGSPCDARFQRAYAEGVAAGAKLKALDTALAGCGVTALGLDGADVSTNFRTIIELDMATSDQRPAFSRLTPCVAAFRRALPAGAPPEVRALQFRIQRPGGAPARRVPLRFEEGVPALPKAPTYLTGLTDKETALAPEKLRLAPDYLRTRKLHEKFAATAQAALAADPAGGGVSRMTFATGVRLDPARLDVIRAYVPACSVPEPNGRPCRTDMAVSLRYDLTTGQTSEVAIARNIRDDRGALALPPFPGR